MRRFLLSIFLFSFFFSVSSFAQKIKTLCSPPTVTMSSDVTICSGQSATISATGSGTTAPYAYAWAPAGSLSNPNISNPSATPSSTGNTTYTCTVTDGLTCTNTGTVNVFVNPTPTVTITGQVSICVGTSGTLTGNGANSYSWNTGQTATTIVVNPTTQTTYTVWGTTGTCTASATWTMNINNPPVIGMGGTGSICMGSNATLNGTGGTFYSWSTGATTNPIVVSPTAQTTYTVWGTSASTGCTNTATGIVNVNNLPTITVISPASICTGNSATLTGNGGDTYSWSTTQTINPIVVSPTAQTTYTVVGTNTVTGCSNTATATVNVNNLPSITITGANPICAGSSATLTGNGGDTYSWSTTQTINPIIVSPTIATTYTVVGTNTVTGCSNSATASVNMNPQPVANAGPDVSICSGSTTTLNGSGNGTYNWSPSGGLSCTTCANPAATVTTNTTYTLTVTNVCGSASDFVSIVINSAPSVNAGPDQTICPGGSTTLVATGSGTFQWSPATGLNCTTCANPTASPSTTTNYTVTITDICGTASDSAFVVIDNPTANISGTNPICMGSSTTLCGANATSYAWSNGSSNSCVIVSPTTASGYTLTTTDSYGCTASNAITVNINSLPTISIAGNSFTCSGVNDTLTASGGIIYSWNTGATTTTIFVNPTSSANYTVTGTDNNGCSNTATFSVTVNPLPVANAGPDISICNGSNATLNGSGNGVYNWNPSGTLNNPNISNPVASPTSNTTYTVTVTNACGQARDTVTVTVNQLPSASITGTSTICFGSSDTLTASGGGTYVWNTTATTTSISVSPTSTANYTVTVTSANGCTKTANFTVNVNTVNAAIAGNNTICSGSNTTLTASGGISYSWNTTQTSTSIIVSPTVPTNYTVVATNSMGCTGTATINVNVAAQPTASVTSTSSGTLCAGNSTTLIASGGTGYIWTPTTGLNNSAISNPVANPNSSVTYTVIVSIGSCSDTASIAVTVFPAATTTLTSTAANVCSGNCATLSASGATSYSWAPSSGLNTTTGNSVTACPTSATTYTVTATDVNGCTVNATSLINVVPPVNLIVSGNTVLCEGTSTVLTVQGGGTYSWSNGATTDSIVVTPPAGSITYTVISTNGSCGDTATITVNVSPQPTVTATANPNLINIGSQTTLNGTTSTGTYNWSPSTGLSSATISDPVANPTITTTYTLCVTDGSGCSACDTVLITVETRCDSIFVPSAFSPNNDQHNDVLCVRGPGDNGGGLCMWSPCVKDIDFTIYNRWGQKVFHTNDMSIGWDGANSNKDNNGAVFFYILNADLINGKFVYQQGNITLVQ